MKHISIKKQNSIFSMLVKCIHLLIQVLFVKLFFCSELKQFLLFKTCKTNSVKVFQVSALQVVIVNSVSHFFIVKMFSSLLNARHFLRWINRNPYIWIGILHNSSGNMHCCSGKPAVILILNLTKPHFQTHGKSDLR